MPRANERLMTWFHPLRQKIVALLRKHGPMTQTELARAIDAAPASARHHLLRLVRGGFVAPAGTRPGPKAITEKLFRVLIQPEKQMQKLKLATKHGTAKDFEMRKMHLDQVAEAHRVGERVIMRDPQTFFSINQSELAATPEKLRELRDLLKQTVVGFLAGLDRPAKGEAVQRVSLNMNMYPAHAPAE
jgi:predicted ArsR family transcriptional regulator